MHTERIRELLVHSGLDPSALRCGIHPPSHRDTNLALIRTSTEPVALHCNCSGKHTNMLLVCQSRDWDLQDYLWIEHPLQQRIGRIITTLGGLDALPPHVIDGCSLPTYVTSMSTLARLYANLAWPEGAPSLENRNIAEHLQLLFHAAVTFPELIGGTDRLDTQLMAALEGKVLAKTGAAGVYAMAVKPDDRFPTGLAIAVKIADGDPSSSVRRVTAVEVLKQLGVFACHRDDQIAELSRPTLKNFRGITIGELRPVFDLNL